MSQRLPPLRFPRSVWVSVAVMVAMLVFDALVFGPAARRNLSAAVTEGGQAERLHGRVVEIASEQELVDEGYTHYRQVVRVQLTEGELAGETLTLVYGDLSLVTEHSRVEAGDRVIVEHLQGPDGDEYLIAGFDRLPGLGVLGIIFAIVTVAVGSWVGVRSLISMGFSLLVIGDFVLLGVVAGYDPLWVCIAGTVLLLVTSYYLIYGWRWKTHTALGGFLVSLVLTGLMAHGFSTLVHLTGMGAEEATSLTLFSSVQIDMRGLLLGGLIIGASGVLDDVTIGQASATFELHSANPSLGWRALFHHGMVIGRDHVASMVNTLLLAYVGAALPMLVLMTLNSASLAQALNRDFLVEEIVRTLVGSLGLLLAVPITSLIASLVAARLPGQPEIL